MIPEKRQDISSLSPSFFIHLYLTHLPWRIPLSEVPHASLALFCTFDISSFLRIVSICLCPLWPPNLLTHPSSWKWDNLFFLFKYFNLVLKSHHESQLHSYYTPFLLPSISGFHFNPSDASVCHVPWSPVKSTLISSCALPLHHHPPTSVTLSARTLKFFLSPLWEVILSLHASWSHCFSLSGASLPVTSCLQLSSTSSASLISDKMHQLPLSFLQFPHCQQVLHLCSLSLPLILTGTPSSCHASWRTKSSFCVLASFCSSTTPYPTS